MSIVGARRVASALDLGCGGGHVAFRLAPLVGAVVACDPAPAMLALVAAEARRRGLGNLTTHRGSAEALDHPPGSFDLVATRWSAHHWRDVPAGLAQIRRVLKPGGQALIMDLVAPEQPLLDTWLQAIELLRDPSHVRDHRLSEWRAMLAAAGLAPLRTRVFRLPLDFAAWTARMATPELQVQAIRALQAQAGSEVRSQPAFAPDGSFTIDTALIHAVAS